MPSLLVSKFDQSFITLPGNVIFSRVPLQPDGKKSAQLAYFNHEENISDVMKIIFQDKTFNLLSPKLIIILEGGLNNNNIEKSYDFNEKQFSASVARLLLDIGRNKLINDKTAPWLFSHIRHDSVASRIIQLIKQQYLANDIPLTRFVDIGIDICQSLPLENAPHDYQSIVTTLLNKSPDELKIGCTNSHRLLNKRLSRIILYGKNLDDLNDRYTIIQKCIEEITHIREHKKSKTLNVPKIILLYGGDMNNVKSIYQLMSIENEEKKFGLVIIRGSGGLADVFAWIYDKIHTDGEKIYIQGSDRILLKSTFLRELKILVNQLLNCDIHDDLITLINYLSLRKCRKIRVCDEDHDLSLYFLEALVSVNENQRLSSLKLHLSLAFDLNQPKFASRMLRTNQDLPEEDLIQLAKMAIIRDQVEFFHVLEDVCGITSDSLGENFDSELSLKMNYNHALFLECIQQNFGCHLEDIYRSIDAHFEHIEDEIQLINVKLFLWAVFFDHYNLSLHFWKRLNDRLCGALVAAHVYRHTADLCVKRSSTESITVQKLRDHANEYENLAIRLLQALYISNPHMARLAIKRENFEFNKFSSLDVAIMSQSENFVGHTGVQEVFDAIWYGRPNHQINGKHFDRTLASTASSFGHATTGMLSKDQQNLFKYLLTAKNKLSRPRVKYHIHFLFYMIFLFLLSYYVLFIKSSLLKINEEINYLNQNITNIKPKFSKQSWSILQIIIHIWVFMFAMEELRQAKTFKTKDIGIGQTLMIYLSESWNKLDCLCIFMYIASVILETYNTKMTSNAARALLAIDVVFWFVRLLVLLMIDRTVGPMLLMVQAMVGLVYGFLIVNDMGTFFSIFFIFTSAYGVASYSLLKSGQLSLDLSIFRKIFHQAYWHVFGQINDLDDIKDNFELTGWAAFALLALYMAISNILLVNLLVAMFSNTFDRMYSKMDTLWKFYRYHIIKEYTILSTLPPPFNLLSMTNNHIKPFYPELTMDQIINLRRREVLAYDSDVFEQTLKDQHSNINYQEKIDLNLRQLKKIITYVKVTCEASAIEIESF